MHQFIQLANVSKNFAEKLVVHDLSFSVAKGEVVGFLGPNGAGKTTTMRMITGYLRPTSGTISLMGNSVETPREILNQHFGYLPEGAPLYPDMTPWDFLAFIADIRKLTPKNKTDRLDFVIETLALKSVLHQPIDTLSKGFKRRVCLAQAVLHDPKILILDEPTDGLDPLQKEEVRRLIRAIASEKAILLSTHVLEEVDSLCSRALVIAGGKIVARGTPDELRANDADAKTILLRTVNSAVEVSRQLENLLGIASVFVVDPHTCRIFLQDISGQESISQAILEKKWQVLELREDSGRLDVAFRNVCSEK